MPSLTKPILDLRNQLSCSGLAEAAFRDAVSVRLKYEYPGDLPKRLVDGLRTMDGNVLPAVTQMVGTIVDVDGAERPEDVRFTVEFGQAPEVLICVYDDLVSIERVDEREMAGGEPPPLAFRPPAKEAHVEALTRRAEGLGDWSENDIEEERVALDPTGDGESNQPPMENAGAAVITKVYLVHRKDPVLIEGFLDDIEGRIARADTNIVDRPMIRAQHVDRDGMLSGEELTIFVDQIQTLKTDNAGRD